MTLLLFLTVSDYILIQFFCGLTAEFYHAVPYVALNCMTLFQLFCCNVLFHAAMFMLLLMTILIIIILLLTKIFVLLSVTWS